MQTRDSFQDSWLCDIAEQYEQLFGQLKRLFQLDCIPLLGLVSVIQEIHLVILVYHTFDDRTCALHKLF
jgi:hypothetical protein